MKYDNQYLINKLKEGKPLLVKARLDKKLVTGHLVGVSAKFPIEGRAGIRGSIINKPLKWIARIESKHNTFIETTEVNLNKVELISLLEKKIIDLEMGDNK